MQKLLATKSTIKIDNPSQFYLAYRWIFLDKTIDFGDVQNLARSCGINLEDFWGRNGFVQKQGKKITVLSALKRREVKKETTLVDIMHRALHLWRQEDQEQLQELLTRTHVLENPLFWQFCQGVAESLLVGNKEKIMLEGLLKNMARLTKRTRLKKEEKEPQKLDDLLPKK